jgi:uncharacterized membrane protein YsdA (DUF1294 family)
MGMYSVLFIYIGLINLIAFILMGADKRKAIKHHYRIPESRLWLFAWMGGAIGATFGMEIFRHKTKHKIFKIGFPLLACLEVAVFMTFYLFISGSLHLQ